MDKINYELMLNKINDFIQMIPDDEDTLLFAAVDLKGDFIELYGDEE